MSEQGTSGSEDTETGRAAVLDSCVVLHVLNHIVHIWSGMAEGDSAEVLEDKGMEVDLLACGEGTVVLIVNGVDRQHRPWCLRLSLRCIFSHFDGP